LEVENIEASELAHVCSHCLHRLEDVLAKASHSRWAHDLEKISDQTFQSLKIDDLDLLQCQEQKTKKNTNGSAETHAASTCDRLE
jgi:hypothetical protein